MADNGAPGSERRLDRVEQSLARPPGFLRLSIYLFLALLLAATAYAALVQVRERITVRGIVRPRGGLAEVDAPAAGRLGEVLCALGSHVRRGDLLFRVDGTNLNAQLEQARSRLRESQARLALLELVREAAVRRHRVEERRDELQDLVSRLEHEKKLAEEARSEAVVKESDAKVRLAEAEHATALSLMQEKIASDLEVKAKEILAEVMKAGKAAALASRDLARKETAVAEQLSSMQGVLAKITSEQRNAYLQEVDIRLSLAAEELKVLRLEETRLEDALGTLEVRAPVSGVVTRLFFRRPGDVVHSGESLARIAPDAALVFEALVATTRAGNIRGAIGSEATLKLDAFPFQEYGVAGGALVEVSPDVEQDADLGPAYRIWIELESLELAGGKKKGKIELGMTATAEILREERSLLSLIFR